MNLVGGFPKGDWFNRESGAENLKIYPYMVKGDEIFIVLDVSDTCGDYGIHVKVSGDSLILDNTIMFEGYESSETLEYQFRSFESLPDYIPEVESGNDNIVDNTTNTEANNDNGYFYEFGYFLEISELEKSPEEMVAAWKNGDAVPFGTVELTYDAKGDYTQLHFPGQETVYVSCQGEITPGVKMTGAEYDVSDGSVLRTYEYYVWLEGNVLYVSRENTKPEEKDAYFKKE